MKILVDINHPAHVHLFRNAIALWREQGHMVRVTARAKDITLELLKQYGIEFEVASVPEKGLLGMARSVLRHDLVVLKQQRKYKFDVLIGTSFAAAHIAKISRAKSVIFNEDDHGIDPLFETITYPLADYIVTPEVLNEDYGKRHFTYDGYHELAYLHPNRYSPNPSILQKLDIDKKESFSIVRFVSLAASHDIKAIGFRFKARKRIINLLEKHGKVFITSEGPLEEQFEKYRLSIEPKYMHDLITYANIIVSDSQTMTAEAAVLGTPSIRYNSFVGRISYLEELEHKYELTFGFRPGEEKEMEEKMGKLLANKGLKEEWEKRKKNMLADKVDVTEWMLKMIEDIGTDL